MWVVWVWLHEQANPSPYSIVLITLSDCCFPNNTYSECTMANQQHPSQGGHIHF